MWTAVALVPLFEKTYVCNRTVISVVDLLEETCVSNGTIAALVACLEKTAACNRTVVTLLALLEENMCFKRSFTQALTYAFSNNVSQVHTNKTERATVLVRKTRCKTLLNPNKGAPRTKAPPQRYSKQHVCYVSNLCCTKMWEARSYSGSFTGGNMRFKQDVIATVALLEKSPCVT